MERIEKAADLLAEARMKQQQWTALPDDCRPPKPEEAYAVQNALVQRLVSNYGGRPVGYKIACTNKVAQEFLKLDGPFYGRLLSAFVQESPGRLNVNDFYMRIIEPEFAFQMAEDLPAAASPYDRDRVAAAVGAVLPAIEIVDSRYKEWTAVGGPSLIADNGCNGAWVQGEGYADWKSLDLSAQEVALVVNGRRIREGLGDAIMGHPINALTWLANKLCQQGTGLSVGDLVSTGTCVDVYHAEAGDEIQADFGPIGVVELTFTG
jgi:2-keto-4-pentenoate hydratase